MMFEIVIRGPQGRLELHREARNHDDAMGQALELCARYERESGFEHRVVSVT